jgi:hypothetical protein
MQAYHEAPAKSGFFQRMVLRGAKIHNTTGGRI